MDINELWFKANNSIMELLKFKCNHCGRISVINAKKILPFLGKIIQVKCGNPMCFAKPKIKVPNIY
jgi:hypothetical protein